MLSSMADARVGISHAPMASACAQAWPASRTRSAIAFSSGVASLTPCELTMRFIVALAIERDLARAVARDRLEAHLLHHRAQRLRLRGGELDELDAVDAHRVRRFGQVLGDGHNEVVKLS